MIAVRQDAIGPGQGSTPRGYAVRTRDVIDGPFRKGQPVWVIQDDGSRRAPEYVGEGTGGFPPARGSRAARTAHGHTA